MHYTGRGEGGEEDPGINLGKIPWLVLGICSIQLVLLHYLYTLSLYVCLSSLLYYYRLASLISSMEFNMPGF